MRITSLRICILSMLSGNGYAVAEDTNVASLFAFNKNARLAMEVGTSFSSRSGQPPQHYAAIHIRDRSTFFGLPSYRLYELGGIIEYSCDDACAYGAGRASYSFETPTAGISQQFTVISATYVSLEVGLGGYIKKPTGTVGSVFTFGERVALISKIEDFELEAFYRHFSNGSFTADNRGYDFVGLTFSARF